MRILSSITLSLTACLIGWSAAHAGVEPDCCAMPDGSFEELSPAGCTRAGGQVADADRCTMVCCDDAAARRQPRSLAACLAVDGVPVDDAACEGCCILTDGEARQMASRDCLDEGGAIGPGALCSPVCCALGVPGAPPHHEMLTGVRCRRAGGLPVSVDWCAERLCCRFLDAQGVLTVGDLDPRGCIDLHGEPVDHELCAPVCCPLPTRPPTVEETSLWDCRRSGAEDWDAMPAPLCEEVCCGRGDRLFSATAGTCREAGGEVVADDRCAAPCCAVGDAFVAMSAVDCAEAGGAPAPQGACAPVCCLADDGSLAITGEGGCDGAVAPVAWCEPRCCEVAPGQYVSALGTCPAEAEPVSMTLCDGVCCRGRGGVFAVTAAPACDAGGGEPVDDGLCLPTCCALPDDSFAVLPIGACQAAGGPPVSLGVEMCDPVCCHARGGYAVSSRAQCAMSDGGEVLDVAACTPVCCVALDDTIVPAAACRGAVRPVEQCDAVCCADEQGLGVSTTAACLPDGEIVEMERCETVCCRRGPDASTELRSACLGDGGEVAPAAWCQEDVCCVLEGQGPVIGSRERCTESGGEGGDVERCEPVCCDTGDGSITVASIECHIMGGEIASDGECAVCCKVDDAEFIYLPQDRCLDPDNAWQEVGASLCDAPRCCALPSGTAVMVTVSQCPLLGGQPVPLGDCDTAPDAGCACRADPRTDPGPAPWVAVLLIALTAPIRRGRSRPARAAKGSRPPRRTP